MIVEKKILGSVGYIGSGSPPESFLWAWGCLIQYVNEFLCRPGEIVHWMRGNQSGQHLARNRMSIEMLGDWLLMLDTDMTFEPDLLYRMLRVFNRPGAQLDILTGLYLYKYPPHKPVLYRYVENKGYQHIATWEDNGPYGVFEVSCAGAGTLLIRSSVFEKLSVELNGEMPFNLIGDYSEDFSFFDRCRRVGIKAYCCPAIRTYHLRQVETDLPDYDAGVVPPDVFVQVPTIH